MNPSTEEPPPLKAELPAGKDSLKIVFVFVIIPPARGECQNIPSCPSTKNP